MTLLERFKLNRLIRDYGKHSVESALEEAIKMDIVRSNLLSGTSYVHFTMMFHEYLNLAELLEKEENDAKSQTR